MGKQIFDLKIIVPVTRDMHALLREKAGRLRMSDVIRKLIEMWLNDEITLKPEE